MKCSKCGKKMLYENTTGRGFDIGLCEKCEWEKPADLPEAGESAERIANTLYEVRTDGLCFICQKPTQNLSPDPSKWRIDLPFNGGNGLTRQYHQGCIVELIHKHFG